MRPVKAALLGLAALGAACAGWALWPAAPLPARFAAPDCRVVPVATPDGPLTGAEDIALEGGTLYVSAYDRAAVAAALSDGRMPPGGGLYTLPLADLTQGTPRAQRLVDPATLPGGLRPHGIDASGGRLAVVNRSYGDGMLRAEVLVYRIGPDPVRLLARLGDDGLCAANDLALAGDRVLVTLDRRNCPGTSWREMLLTPDSGRLVALPLTGVTRPEPVAQGFRFANGVAVTAQGIAVAETRASRIALEGREIALPGGPDNLSVTSDGRMVTALHPDLLHLSLTMSGWLKGSPSRIVAIAPDGTVEMLYDDPEARFSAATSAILTPAGGLIAGSALDEGLLVCGAME